MTNQALQQHSPLAAYVLKKHQPYRTGQPDAERLMH